MKPCRRMSCRGRRHNLTHHRTTRVPCGAAIGVNSIHSHRVVSVSASPQSTDLVSRLSRPSSAITGRELMQQRLAPMRRYSITSSARASSVGGTSRPRMRAVCALISISNLADCSTGKSAGLVPLRMRPTYTASCR
jgi:hypothetical protein